MATFTPLEIEEMQKDPYALRALANYHSIQETEADAIGDFKQCVEFHKNRRIALDAEADEIEAEWDRA
jgi:hypothetical protein